MPISLALAGEADMSVVKCQKEEVPLARCFTFMRASRAVEAGALR